MEEIFFLNYQRGINSWTPTDLSGKCDDDEIEKSLKLWQETKGLWVNTSFLLFAFCSSQNLFLFAGKKKKTFCARFWDCRPGCHSIVKKKYWNKDVKVRIAVCLGLFFTESFFSFCKMFLKYFIVHLQQCITKNNSNIFFCQWCCLRQLYLHCLDTRG